MIIHIESVRLVALNYYFFKSMQNFIESCTIRKHISINVEPIDRIEDIEEKIQDKEGIPPNQLGFISSGKEIVDRNTLQDCSIQK